ncbi:MAG: glucoamylase family protein, partial [Opitutaceae bacterium]
SEGKASIASSGFALSAWVIAVQRGWVDRPVAVARIRTMLRFLAEQAPRQHGFFYHFMEMDTGARAWKCELSTIDTGLFLAGAILAREYFRDPEITELVDRLYRGVDWPWFLNGGRTFTMGWYDEAGFSRFRWDKYSELMMLTLLGLGASERPVDPELWRAWARAPVGTYGGYHYIQGPQLFVHQFTQAYVDFRGRRDAFADYYRNSILATLAQRKFCLDLRSEFPSWDGRLWGLTSSDSATGYKSWGGPPRTTDFNALDGTVVPCAPAGSLPFAPVEAMTALQYMRTAYGDRIWRRYGFADAFNPETGWVDPDVIGIDVGISLLQAENVRTGFVWAVFMQAPEVQRALARAGFLPTGRNLDQASRDALRGLAARAWQALGAPAAALPAGLALSSIMAAQALGFVSEAEAVSRGEAWLRTAPVPQEGAEVAEYAAGLVTLRQAIPGLAVAAARRLAAIDWKQISTRSNQLGALDRLTVFFQVAAGVRPPSAWTDLERTPEQLGPVYVLAPASVRGQLLPGLWLDESSVIAGASAAQFAYARALDGVGELKAFPYDVLTAALLIEHFPAALSACLKDVPPPSAWLGGASLADQAALLASVANLLAPDCLRQWFQEDPLVQTGRAAIPEFAEADFGRDTSIVWRRQLAGPLPVPPERLAVAVPATVPRDQWRWTEMTGHAFKDSAADTRPGDPVLALRFAFTWDQDALHFHAVVTDGLPKVATPSYRNGVELFVDPQNDGLVWAGAHDYQFSFRADGAVTEWFHQHPVRAQVRPADQGYAVEADIRWSDLGVTPRPGLELGVSPAVVSEGSYEWEPSLKLNWRYYDRADERKGLGTLRLE